MEDLALLYEEWVQSKARDDAFYSKLGTPRYAEHYDKKVAELLDRGYSEPRDLALNACRAKWLAENGSEAFREWLEQRLAPAK